MKKYKLKLRRSRTFHIFYSLLKSILRILFRLLYRIEVTGYENIPDDGRLILCCNHLSYIDPLIIAVFFPRNLYYMAKKEVFKNRMFGKFLSFFNAFPVDRNTMDRKAIRDSIDVLNSGGVLTIFPEGTRSSEGIIKDGHRGVGYISLLSNSSPILPVAISGTNKIIRKPHKRIYFPKIRVIFGELICTNHIIRENDTRIASNMILNLTMDSIKELYIRIK